MMIAFDVDKFNDLLNVLRTSYHFKGAIYPAVSMCTYLNGQYEKSDPNGWIILGADNNVYDFDNMVADFLMCSVLDFSYNKLYNDSNQNDYLVKFLEDNHLVLEVELPKATNLQEYVNTLFDEWCTLNKVKHK